jgi:hypothetical protein
MGTGDTQEPVAWAVYKSDGQPYDVFYSDPACDVERMRAEWMAISGATFVPLYREPQPTLTDAEREAIRFASVFYDQGGRAADAATLRNLLERLQ